MNELDDFLCEHQCDEFEDYWYYDSEWSELAKCMKIGTKTIILKENN